MRISHKRILNHPKNCKNEQNEHIPGGVGGGGNKPRIGINCHIFKALTTFSNKKFKSEISGTVSPSR